MGKGICSRRQRRIFQAFLILIFVFGTLCAFIISYEMQRELMKSEATALKYQQHQESLSAQLQVVYEHHSKLEKSLQKERLEHKKTEEDFLLFKLESQKALNKEKQDSTNRLKALQSEHQILKSQHEDLKMDLHELQEKHQNQGDNHERVLDEHRLEMDHMQREKEVEISRLKENVYNLKEENRHLRRAHQDIYTQLLDVREQHKELKASNDRLTLTIEDHKNALVAAQLQVEELRRLKETRVDQAVTIHKLPNTANTQSHILETVEHRQSLIEELDNQVERNEERGKGLPPHGVLEIENNKRTQAAVKQPHQIGIFTEGKSKKDERSTSKDGGGGDESKKEVLEHSLSNPKELGINPGYILSQTPEKQTQTEVRHTTQVHSDGLNLHIPKGHAGQSHVLAEQDDIKDVEDTQKHDKQDLNSKNEANNQDEDELEDAEDKMENKHTTNQDRPEEDEQLVVAGNPEQAEERVEEQYEEDVGNETLDESVHNTEKRRVDEDDPYSENNGEQPE